MRYDAPTTTDFETAAAGGQAARLGASPYGPEVLPGTYSVSVTVDGHTETASAHVIGDPNQPPALAAQKRSLQLALRGPRSGGRAQQNAEPHQRDAVAAR